MESAIKKVDFARLFEITKGRVSQLIALGVLKPDKDGHLPARESIEALVLYRHRPRRKPSGNSSIVDLDLSDLLKEFSEGGAK